MSSANAKLVRRGYEAWNQGDIEAVFALLDPEIKWQGYTHIPESGTLAGRDEVKAWRRRFLEAWEELDVEVIDLVEDEDQVIALVRLRGLGKESGAKVDSGVDAHVWTVRDGRVVGVTLHQGTR